jgi:hypothetical protein
VASLYLNPTPPSPAWNSQALYVRKSADITDQTAGTPILDVDMTPPSTSYQYLGAIVGNADQQQAATNVRVQLWAFAVSTGPTVPGLCLASMGSTKGATVPAGAGITVGAGQVQAFERHWNQADGLAAGDQEIIDHFVGGEVHCCIYGNVYGDNDPASAEIPDDPANGPAPSLHIATNPHHAQRNMTIKQFGAAEAMVFNLFATPADTEGDPEVRLEILETAIREPDAWLLAELDALGPWIRRTRKAPRGGLPGIEVIVDGEVAPVRIGKPLDDLEIDVDKVGCGRELEFELDRGEARRMRINATLGREDFVLRVFDVVQTRRKEIVGGVRLMAMTVPEELRPPRRKRG